MLNREEEHRLDSVIKKANHDMDHHVNWADEFTTETVLWLALNLKKANEKLAKYERDK